MVGGLADWFAVTALFRHPLGIPIPHTALLRRNQAKAARNVGRFFEAHFLEPAKLEERLRSIEIARHAAGWLAHPGNALALVAPARRRPRDDRARRAEPAGHRPRPGMAARRRRQRRGGRRHRRGDRPARQGRDAQRARRRGARPRPARGGRQPRQRRRAGLGAQPLVDRQARGPPGRRPRRRRGTVASSTNSAPATRHCGATSRPPSTGRSTRFATNGSLERAVAEARAHLVRSGALETLAAPSRRHPARPARGPARRRPRRGCEADRRGARRPCPPARYRRRGARRSRRAPVRYPGARRRRPAAGARRLRRRGHRRVEARRAHHPFRGGARAGPPVHPHQRRPAGRR